MKVIKARVLGFCMGVRRAVDIAVDAAKKNKDIFTIGPLIHNPKVLDDLAKLGIQVVNENALNENSSLLPDNCSLLPVNCSLIIRAHGINPFLEKKISNCNLIDATCPKVKANQLKTRELVKEGYFIFLAGEAHHAEIEGLLGYASSDCMIVGDLNEARNAAAILYEENPSAKTALLGQTTISKDEYEKIADEIKKIFPELKIVNTICSATEERQTALREMLPKVDAVIIAGGNESANTRRLYAIAKESGKPCVLIENAENIPKEFFDFETVGISAGASTPDSIVEEIEGKILTTNHTNTH